jgi:hypothetical protein
VLPGEIEEVPDYVGLLRGMCDDFDLFKQRDDFILGPHARDPLQFMFVYGLTFQANYMVRRCLPLLADSTIVAVPILRSVFECGVMAQWLRWVPGSEMSLHDEARRQMVALSEDLNRSSEPSYRENVAWARRVLGDDWPDLFRRAACQLGENCRDLRCLPGRRSSVRRLQSSVWSDSRGDFN